jgi:glycosyltransferase involved in cell wall biosynthesis
MKIIFQYFYGGGGAVENFYCLLSAFITRHNNKHQFIIVCDKSSKLCDLNKYDNVIIHHPNDLKIKELSRLYLGLIGFKKLITYYNPDLVWSLNLGSYTKLTIPNVLSLNNAHQVYPIEQTQSHPGSRLRVQFLRFFFRVSLSKSDQLITQTETIANHVRQIKNNTNIAVIPKVAEIGMDSVALKKTTTQQLEGLPGVKLLYIATNYAHKNHSVIIDALDELINKGQNISLILSLSNEEAIDIAGIKAKKLINKGVLLCLGWVEKSTLKSIYDITDICLMPSKLESLSSSHLEAMSWSVPQIVSDLPFARETCGNAALYANADLCASWVEKIGQLIDDPLLKDLLIDRGHGQLDKYPKNWDDMAQLVELNFEKILQSYKLKCN